MDQQAPHHYPPQHHQPHHQGSPQQPKQRNWFARHPILSTFLGLFAFVFIVGLAGGASNQQQSSPAAPDKPDSQTQETKSQPAQPAAPQVLLDLKGTGTKQTQKFTAGGDWDLEWSYDCSGSYGNQGNFIVTVYEADGSPSFQNTSVNQLGAKGADVQHYHKGGTFYLDITSQCTWRVVARG